MKVVVVILNWNGKYLLEKFLPEVIRYSMPDTEVYVVDNASADDSINLLKAKFPEVKIIINQGNYGYAKGYNEGLKHIPADYFVLLNSDVQVTPNWIKPVINLMESDKQIVACQPKLLNYNVRDEFEYAGGAGGFIDKWGYPFCRGRMFDSFEKDNGQYNNSREIFWASGACLFIRSKEFFEAGGLDADFFAHMEEIDLCWRLRNRGYKIYYCSESTIYHVGAGTLAKASTRKTFYNFRNNLLMITKNHAPGFLFIKIFLRQVLDGIGGIKFLIKGQYGHCFAIVRAHFSFYEMLSQTMRKRRRVQQNIKRYATSGVYNGSVVWQYFAMGKKKYSDLDQTKFI